jgi:hypothetical protein
MPRFGTERLALETWIEHFVELNKLNVKLLWINPFANTIHLSFHWYILWRQFNVTSKVKIKDLNKPDWVMALPLTTQWCKLMQLFFISTGLEYTLCRGTCEKAVINAW